MNPKWSIQKCIQERVEKESWQAWGSEPSFTQLKPRLEAYNNAQRQLKPHVNWYIFFKTCVMAFRP